MPFAAAKRLIYICGISVITQGAWAALQTTPYIAIHSQPKYAGLTHLPYANPAAPKGGYLSQSANGTFDNLNAMNGKGTAADGVEYLFDTLMVSSLDEPGVMYPLLAKKVTYDPKKTAYVIYHLNPKARFSDGTPVTAEDIKFSFDTYTTKGNPGLQMYLSDLDKTEVLSRYQVKMSFKSNNNYWAKDLPINRGKYNFDRLKFVYYRNMDVGFEGFKSGQYTVHQEYTARKWVTEYNFSAIKDKMVVKYNFNHENPIPTQSFVFNTRRAPMQDIRFRQALTYAYDFEWQNKALFYGQYHRLQSYFANSELEAKGMPSVEELAILKPYLAKLDPIERAGVLKDWKYPVSDASGFNRKNLLVARELLLEAGYRYHNAQLTDPKAKPIRLEFLIHQDGLQRTLVPFIRNLKRLGITVNIRHVDVPQYIERMRSKDFDMTTNVLPQSLNPGNEQAQFWSSASADQPGNYNYAGIKNAVIDDAITKVIQAPDRQQLVIRTKVLDRLLRAGYYQIPTYGKGGNWYAYWNMYEQPKIKPKLAVGFDFWWSNPQKAAQVSQYLRRQK